MSANSRVYVGVLSHSAEPPMMATTSTKLMPSDTSWARDIVPARPRSLARNACTSIGYTGIRMMSWYAETSLLRIWTASWRDISARCSAIIASWTSTDLSSMPDTAVFACSDDPSTLSTSFFSVSSNDEPPSDVPAALDVAVDATLPAMVESAVGTCMSGRGPGLVPQDL